MALFALVAGKSVFKGYDVPLINQRLRSEGYFRRV
jgi:hypothetical protein